MNFILNILHLQVGIFIEMFLCHFECELFFSPKSRKSIGDLQNEIWKELEKNSFCNINL